MANAYDRGDTIRLAATFNSSAGIYDPATVMAFVANPQGSVATYPTASLTRVATGCYTLDIVPSLSPPNGAWSYRFEGTPAPGAAAGEGRFVVRITSFL